MRNRRAAESPGARQQLTHCCTHELAQYRRRLTGGRHDKRYHARAKSHALPRPPSCQPRAVGPHRLQAGNLLPLVHLACTSHNSSSHSSRALAPRAPTYPLQFGCPTRNVHAQITGLPADVTGCLRAFAASATPADLPVEHETSARCRGRPPTGRSASATWAAPPRRRA
jgi:hypothetical protein